MSATERITVPAARVCGETRELEWHLPSLVQADAADLDLVGWLHEHRTRIEEQLLRHGAVLFRGFGVASIETFEHCAEALCPDLFREYGDLPREGTTQSIYESTPYPANREILFHNEASHTPSWPLKQWFFCVTPAQEGGRTPLVDCRRVYERLDASVRDAFARKQLTYVRNFIDGLDVSWKDFFKTTDRAVVEARCRAEGVACEWTRNGQLRTSRRCPAVITHPRTGETVFFNQIQLHHVSCLPAATRRAMSLLYAEEDLPRNVYFGDGTAIDDAIVEHVLGIYRDLASGFDWQAGDVLLVDNVLTAHGRDRFVGPRKIVVAMGEMQSGAALSEVR